MTHDPAILETVDLSEIFTSEQRRDLVEAVRSGDAEINLKNYSNLTEWIMHILLVGVLHAVPEATTKDAIKISMFVAQRLYLPGTLSVWKVAARWVDRYGLTQAARRVTLELRRTMISADKT